MRARRFVRLLRWGRLRGRSAGDVRPVEPVLPPAPPAKTAPICIGGIDSADLAALQALGGRFLVDARRSVGDRHAAEQWAARWLALVLWLRAARGDGRALRVLRCASPSNGLPVSPDEAMRLLAELLEQELLRQH